MTSLWYRNNRPHHIQRIHAARITKKGEDTMKKGENTMKKRLLSILLAAAL